MEFVVELDLDDGYVGLVNVVHWAVSLNSCSLDFYVWQPKATWASGEAYKFVSLGLTQDYRGPSIVRIQD